MANQKIFWILIKQLVKGTGNKLDFDQLKRLLGGADTQLQIIYPEFLARMANLKKKSAQLAKTQVSL